MGNPTFSFQVSNPVNNQGRWFKGRVSGDKDGYTLHTDLCFSRNVEAGDLQIHRLDARLDRDFSPSEFARLLEPLRTGRFSTATDEIQVTVDDDAGWPMHEIEAALSLDPDQQPDPTPELARYIASVCEKLDEVRRREILGRSFMMVGSRPGTHIIIGDPCNPRPAFDAD